MKKKLTNTQDFFEKTEYWRQWFTVGFSLGLETYFLLDLLKPFKNQRIKLLEVACGHGRILYPLKKSYPNFDLFGVDINQNALKIAQKKVPKAKLKKASAYKLPFPEQSFDAVVCVASFMHFEDPKKALNEMMRVSKDIVYFNISTKNNLSESLRNLSIMKRSPTPEYKYSSEEIQKILSNKEFSWEIRGGLFISHKMVSPKLFNYLRHIDRLLPAKMLEKYGHMILITGTRKKKRS